MSVGLPKDANIQNAIVTGISVNVNDLIENTPELIFIVPAIIFGYLFYLAGDSAFLHIAAI